jgi:heme/copper-type cytochrome/quinol oxidase subunit 4
MKGKIARSLLLGFFLALFLILLAILVISAGGLTNQTSTTGNMLFGILMWNVLLAIYLIKEGWLPVSNELSLLFTILFGFLFGWILYSGLIYLGMLAFGKRAKDPPDTSL